MATGSCVALSDTQQGDLFETLWDMPEPPGLRAVLEDAEHAAADNAAADDDGRSGAGYLLQPSSEVLATRIARVLDAALELPCGVGGISRHDFWAHCWATARAAEMLARYRGQDAGRALLAGLLHDLGKLILAASIPDTYAACVAQSVAGGSILYQAERAGLGIDHCSVGACALRNWGLPNAAAVEEHHRPRRLIRVSTMGRVIQAANAIGHASGIGCSGNSQPIMMAMIDDPEITLCRASADLCLKELKEQTAEIARLAAQLTGP